MLEPDLETRLRALRGRLPLPSPAAAERARTTALAALPRAPRQRDFRSSPSAAHKQRLYSRSRSSLGLGTLAGGLLWPRAGAAGGLAPDYPGPSFAPAANWTTVASGRQPAEPTAYAANAWATNIPLATQPGPHGVFPFGGTELKTLPADGVLIVVWLGAPQFVPAPASVNYPDRSLPIQLSDAQVRPNWEGQPSRDIPEYLLNSRIKDQWVDIRVYFGTQHPSEDLLRTAQAELARLAIPD